MTRRPGRACRRVAPGRLGAAPVWPPTAGAGRAPGRAPPGSAACVPGACVLPPDRRDRRGRRGQKRRLGGGGGGRDGSGGDASLKIGPSTDVANLRRRAAQSEVSEPSACTVSRCALSANNIDWRRIDFLCDDLPATGDRCCADRLRRRGTQTWPVGGDVTRAARPFSLSDSGIFERIAAKVTRVCRVSVGR